MSQILTPQMIIKRSRGNYDLSSIIKLNFWGQSLSDISVLSECKSLVSATFSKNFITSLRCFKGMNYLKELSLASNSINDFRELEYLGTCTSLQKLWLRDNPISTVWDYRVQVIRYIPQLKYLDDQEVTNEEREIANTGSFFVQNYEKKRENVRPPSHDPFHSRENRYRNNFEQYGGVYNRGRRDIDPEETDDNYLGILPGMNNENKFKRFQKKKSDTPGNKYDRYSGRKKQVPFNNYPYEDDDFKGKNNINVQRNISYNEYGRNIPGSAQSHNRKYGNSNPMEVSTTNTQQGQQRVVDCVSVLIKGLNKDELKYIVDHIDKKISKI